MKRGVWIAACLIGVAVFGGLAVLTGLMTYWSAQEDAHTPSGFIEMTLTLVAIAAACGSVLFFAPREIDKATAIEVDEDPAQWIKDMRRQNEADDGR